MRVTQLNLGGPFIILALVIYILATCSGVLSPDDGILLQWRPEDPDPCRWKGVKCNPNSKRVIYFLYNHNLSGSIPPDLGKLNQLEVLVLQNNNFHGNIPSELWNCTALQTLPAKIGGDRFPFFLTCSLQGAG